MSPFEKTLEFSYIRWVTRVIQIVIRIGIETWWMYVLVLEILVYSVRWLRLRLSITVEYPCPLEVRRRGHWCRIVVLIVRYRRERLEPRIECIRRCRGEDIDRLQGRAPLVLLWLVSHIVSLIMVTLIGNGMLVRYVA